MCLIINGVVLTSSEARDKDSVDSVLEASAEGIGD